MNEPENINPANEFEQIGDDDYWSDNGEDISIEKQNLYDMLENGEICESFIVANHIYVRHTNSFVRDYTESELETIRAYFNMEITQSSKPEGISWSGNINTSSFKLCLEYIDVVESITLTADVGLHGITHMCQALTNNTSVTSVTSLTIHYPIDVTSIRILGAFLETNTTIKTLVMKIYKTTFETVKVLFSFLKKNTTITHITLYNDSFGTKGAQILPWIIKSPLQSLDIGNTIGNSCNKIFIDTLRNNTSLTYLNLKKNNIGDAGIVALSKMLKTNKTLLKIDLKGNGITNKSIEKILEMLAVNNTLTHMMLDKNKITVDGFNNLVCLDNLSLTHFFNYEILDNGKVIDTYSPYKVKDVPNLYTWLLRNVRIFRFKNSLLEFKRSVVGQLPDELIDLVQECL
jgi:hypothetical protein